jgi:predicted nucleic acid-binding protein
MNILLDTNVLFGDWTLRSADAQAFLDYVENTSSTIYVPRIVWEEIKKNQHEDLAKKYEAYEAACKRLGSSMVNQPDFKVVKFEHAITGDDYLDWLRKKLSFDVLENVLPYGDYTERIANRVMAKRKPFNLQNSNEYKDSLVWETVLDVVTGNMGKKAEEVVFISNDVNAFGAGKNQQEGRSERGVKGERQIGVLHPQLQEDVDTALAQQQVKRFYYYETFAEFLATHYMPIQGINPGTVLSYLASEESGFLRVVQEIIQEGLPQITANIVAYNAGANVEAITAPFTFKRFSALQDFYVYSFNKGEHVTASCRVFIYMSMTATYTYNAPEGSREVALHPVVEVKLHIPYQDGKPEAIVFDDTHIPADAWMRLPNKALRPRSPYVRWVESSGNARTTLVSRIEEILWEKTQPSNFLSDLDWDSLLGALEEEKRTKLSLPTVRPPVDPAARKGRKRSR